ncbi:MAG TPA: redox-regulated ATPase YchF [Tepidisphaeraceae bacterium]|nr:redox-regulated ATPase YchF [Tepidisphaeraceae bacterium]
MALQVGIVGLPLVGKTTIFNALTSGQAHTAAFTGRADKPNIGVARIPDQRLHILNQYIQTKRIVPATIQIVDVPGLARGASAGQGLGNKFLAHIRDMDAIIHVVRCFQSDQVPHHEGTIDPVRDIDTVQTELILADLESVANSLDRAKRAARGGEREAVARAELLEKAYETLNQGRPVRELSFTPEQSRLIKSMGLLTAKKTLFVANVGEDDVQGAADQVQAARQRAESEGGLLVPVCGKLEAEIAQLPESDRQEMLKAMGLSEPALAVLARAAYKLLGLHSFLTAGPEEIRAWTIPIGAKAPQAAGAVHSDLEKSFIRAEVYQVEDLVHYKSEQAIRAAGKLRLEGKDYIIQDGDVVHFQAGLAGRR